MSAGAQHQFRAPGYAEGLLRGLHKLRKNTDFCDIQLITGKQVSSSKIAVAKRVELIQDVLLVLSLLGILK